MRNHYRCPKCKQHYSDCKCFSAPTADIIDFPANEELPPLLVGPFSENRVVVDERIIPRLTGFHDGDKIALVLDRRFSASFAPEDAYRVAWLIANALAIGEGYASMYSLSKDQPFASIAVQLDALPKDSP